MIFSDYIQLLGLLLVIGNITVSVWNSYQHNNLKLIIAELQLNLRKELNGRYVVISSFEDARERIKRLEDNALHIS